MTAQAFRPANKQRISNGFIGFSWIPIDTTESLNWGQLITSNQAMTTGTVGIAFASPLVGLRIPSTPISREHNGYYLHILKLQILAPDLKGQQVLGVCQSARLRSARTALGKSFGFLSLFGFLSFFGFLNFFGFFGFSCWLGSTTSHFRLSLSLPL